MKPQKKARDVMIRKIVTVQPELRTHDAAVILLKHKISSVPVVSKDSEPLGEFSEQSCMNALFHAVFEDAPDRHVRSYVKPWSQTLELDDSLMTMVEKYSLTRQRILPVIEDDRIVGIVTRSQMIRTVLHYLGKPPDNKTRPIYLSALKKKDPPPHLLE